jgi:hypothetical protein
MLCEKFDKKSQGRHLIPLDSWKPFPKAEDRDGWKKILRPEWKRKISSEILIDGRNQFQIHKGTGFLFNHIQSSSQRSVKI